MGGTNNGDSFFTIQSRLLYVCRYRFKKDDELNHAKIFKCGLFNLIVSILNHFLF